MEWLRGILLPFPIIQWYITNILKLIIKYMFMTLYLNISISFLESSQAEENSRECGKGQVGGIQQGEGDKSPNSRLHVFWGEWGGWGRRVLPFQCEAPAMAEGKFQNSERRSRENSPGKPDPPT